MKNFDPERVALFLVSQKKSHDTIDPIGRVAPVQ